MLNGNWFLLELKAIETATLTLKISCYCVANQYENIHVRLFHDFIVPKGQLYHQSKPVA